MKNLIILFFVLVPYYLIAQPAPIKWKDIPIEDLKMKDYEQDPTASAVVLCDYGQMYFDTNPNGRHLFLFYDRHMRIKIIKEEGVKHAKINIPFHDIHCEKFFKESSIVIDARVYNLADDGKIISKKIKKKDISYRDSTGCYKIAEFTIPEVKVGSVIEYKYRVPSLDLVYPQSWYFQTNIPIRHSEFRMRVPRDFQYLISPVNIQNFDVNKQQAYNKSVYFDLYRYYRRSGSSQRYAIKNKVNIDLSGKSFQLVKKNIPTFTCHGLIDLPEDHKQKLNIHLVKINKNTYDLGWEQLTYSLMTTTDDSYKDRTPEQRRMINYPAGYIIYQLSDWGKLNNDLLKHERFGLPLIMYWNYRNRLDSIIRGKENQHEKMKAIYDYIRKNIKWNGQYDIYTNRVLNPFIGKVYTKITNKVVNEKSLRRPFENKTGTSSEINFILIYLLNKAGIETHPVLLSTRKNGKVDENIADAEQFNHVIAYTEVQGQKMLLDATDSLRPFYLLKQNSIGVDGLIVRKKDPGWIKITNTKKNNTQITSNLTLDDKLNLLGTLNCKITGYEALSFRKGLLKYKNKNFVNSKFQTEFPEYSLKNIKVSNLQKETDPLLIQAGISIESGNVSAIKPMISINYNENFFPDIIRTCPIDFAHPFLKEYELNLRIPEGFKAEIPDNAEYKTYGDHAFFSYNIKDLGANNLKLKIKLELKISKFPTHEYQNLAEFFTNVNDKLKEEIIIKKGI